MPAAINYITVLASKPGNPPPKVEKRTADSRVFQIDCTPLLTGNELVHGKVKAISPDLKITELKPRLGKYVRFRVEGGPIDIPHSDYTINIVVQTSSDNELAVPIVVRAYSL